MSPAVHNEQGFRELKGSVGDTWAVESPPPSEWVGNRAKDTCLMRNEKADWSPLGWAQGQFCVPRDGSVTFCRLLSVLTPIVSDGLQ